MSRNQSNHHTTNRKLISRGKDFVVVSDCCFLNTYLSNKAHFILEWPLFQCYILTNDFLKYISVQFALDKVIISMCKIFRCPLNSGQCIIQYPFSKVLISLYRKIVEYSLDTLSNEYLIDKAFISKKLHSWFPDYFLFWVLCWGWWFCANYSIPIMV